MAITITGTLIIDETSGLQNATAGGSDSTGNDVEDGLGFIDTGVLAFDTLLNAVVVQNLTGVNVTVAVSNGTSADPDGSSMLSGFGADVTDLAFTNSTGGPLLGEEALSAPGVSLLTVDGRKIYLYSYTGADLGIDENNVVFGRKANADGTANASGDVVFAAYLQPTDASGAAQTSDLNAVGSKVWLVQYEEIKHPITTNPDDALSLYNLHVTVSNRSDFSLAGAPSGQNLFLMYGDGTPSLADAVIIVTGKNPINQSEPNAPAITSGDTVNTGQGGGPTTLGTNSQQIVAGTGLYFTFAKGANPDFTVNADHSMTSVGFLDQNEADVEAKIDFASLYESNGASFSVVQSSSGDKSTLKISAYTTAYNPRAAFIDNLHNNTAVEVNKVAITTQPTGHGKNAVPGETLVFDKVVIGTNPTTLSGITVTFSDDKTVEIKGLEADDLIAYNTDVPHNRVLIDNIGSTDTNFDAPFDIGGFALVNSNVTPNLFSALTFQDDGPSVTVSATNESAVLLTTQDAETDGNPTDQDSAATTVDFSGVFGNLPSYGTDGPALVNPTTMSYALSLYGADGSDSLLDSNGVQINLYNVSGLIVGSTALNAVGITTGNTIFSIGVVPSGTNAGIVTLTQYAEIDHALENPTTAPFDDQFAILANNLVKLTGTALSTDGDGDTATDSEDVDLGGNVRFADDGPSVTVSATNESAVLLTTQDAETDGNPTAQDSAATTLDFSSVFGNLPIYGADGAGTTVKSYVLSLYGADGSDSLLDSNGVQINLYNVSGLIVGSTALSAVGITTGNTIFSIGVVPSGANAGIVTLTQYAEIDHALENPTTAPFDDQFAVLANNLVKLTGTALSTDGDGDTATDSEDVDLGGNVRFADDGPSVTVSATNESAILLTTQDAETDGNPTAQDSAATTVDFSGVFGNLPVYGADGAGTTVKSYVLSLYGADGSDSLLDSNGVQINLYNVSGLIVGSTALSAVGITTGNTIFSIGVVPSGANAGIVTLTQYAEIDHALETPTTAPFDDQFAVLANNLVKLTGTALSTDGDGDTATDSEDVDLGGNVRFADDGPSVTVSATNESAILLTTQDAETDGNPTAQDSAATTVDFSGVFGNLPVYGADGAGTTVKSYVLSLYGADGSDSLLDSNGVQINLYNVSGLIVGSTALSAVGITTGNTIFSIGVVPSGANAGIVTLTQYAEIDHALETPTTAPFDDQFAVLANNLIKLTGTALSTDGDGDTASDSEDVDLGGNVRFADDGPSVTVSATNESAILLTTQDAETDGNPTAQDSAATTLDFSGVFGNLPIYGADGAGTTVKSYVLSLYGADGSDSLLDSNGVQINLYNVSGLIVGSTALSAVGITTGNTIFSIGVVPSGANAGIVTLTQYAEIDHALENPTTAPFDDQFAVLANNLVKLTGTALSTDGDGDTATDSEDVDLGGNVRFADDGPSVTVSATNESTILLTTQDAETDGNPTAQDSAATTVDFSGVFGNLPVYGADGAGTTVKSYVLSLYGADGSDSLLDSNGVQINLYNVSGLIVGSTALSAVGITTGNTIFSIGVVPSGANAGIVTLTQYAEIDHALETPTTAPFDDQFAVLANNLIKLTGTALSTDGDGDTASDSEDVDLGGNVRFADDGPSVSANATVLLDDDALTGNPGGTNDDADSDNVNGTLGHVFGADGAGTVAYLTSGAPTGFSYVADSTSLLVKQTQNGVLTTVLTLTMVPGSGAYTVVQNNPILHAAGLTENNQAFTINYRVTDGDGDTADGTLGINVDDDTPVVTAKSSLVYANTSNSPPVTDVGGTGVFAYSIGADKHVAPYSDPAGLTPNSDFLSVALTGVTVGANAITNKVVTWVSETDSQAVFNVGFTYVSNNPAQGATSNATGTLIFDKVADTYTLKLAQEIESFSILNTSTPGNPLQGYALNLGTTVGSNPPVSVMTLASNFFVQFEGFGVINGTAQTFAYDTATGLFSNDRRYVTVSSASIGAASDTLQSDEVIDLDFFAENPKGFTNDPTLTRASSKAIFIEFTQAGPGAGKDMLVVLKLVDDNNPALTINRTFIVGNSAGNDDVLNANVPAYGFVAQAQNGIVVFESNDYNFTGEHYSIQGAQVVTSTQGTSGTGYQLNGVIDNPATPNVFEGATPDGQIAFGGATTEGNNEPIKIVNIGFVASTTPDAHLTFDVVLADADGDATATQTLDVTIVGDDRVTASTGADTFVIADTDVDGLLSMVLTVIDGGFATGIDTLNFTAPGSGTNYTEVLIPAATNLAAFTAAADTALDGTTDYYFGVVGGDGYLAFDGDGNGITTIIQLVGVTDIASTDIV